MSSVGHCRSLGTLLRRQIFAGALPTSRTAGSTRWIFNAFSSNSEKANASAKEGEQKTEEGTEVEKLIAEKDGVIAEKEKEIRDMKV